MALAALGGAGYLYYELIYTGDTRAVVRELEALESAVAGVDQRFAELADRQQSALEELRTRQESARAETERALRQSLAEVARQAQQGPPTSAEWRRAEARYLLRIANHRLLMEYDVEGTLRLLEAADAVLADLDDFALHDVRARLADEIAALRGLEQTDLQGLFLRLEAAKRELDQLPLRLPEYVAAKPAPAPAVTANDPWSVLKRQLAGMLEFRRLDSEVKPLLQPEEAVYLELNLRLMLERAQLAAVRREQLIYEASLATAIDWIHDYLATDNAAVGRLLEELTALQQLDLAQPLPDISGSLNALQSVPQEGSRDPA